jgi:hypothetical protein
MFLDVDGVLNRTAFRPAESRGLVSWIEPELAARVARGVAELAHRHVRISPLRGFDDEAAAALRASFTAT